MSRIQKAFENKKAFIAFLTAGDPSLDKTVEDALLRMARVNCNINFKRQNAVASSQ